jgi:hypothetical protein
VPQGEKGPSRRLRLVESARLLVPPSGTHSQVQWHPQNAETVRLFACRRQAWFCLGLPGCSLCSLHCRSPRRGHPCRETTSGRDRSAEHCGWLLSPLRTPLRRAGCPRAAAGKPARVGNPLVNLQGCRRRVALPEGSESWSPRGRRIAEVQGGSSASAVCIPQSVAGVTRRGAAQSSNIPCFRSARYRCVMKASGFSASTN